MKRRTRASERIHKLARFFGTPRAFPLPTDIIIIFRVEATSSQNAASKGIGRRRKKEVKEESTLTFRFHRKVRSRGYKPRQERKPSSPDWTCHADCVHWKKRVERHRCRIESEAPLRSPFVFRASGDFRLTLDVVFSSR